jgi:hypothetical protein
MNESGDPNSKDDGGDSRSSDMDSATQDWYDAVVCSICGSGEDDDNILLCDVCNDSQHLYCCTPKLDVLPLEEEMWFCFDCNKEVQKEERRKNEKTVKSNKDKRGSSKQSSTSVVLSKSSTGRRNTRDLQSETNYNEMEESEDEYFEENEEDTQNIHRNKRKNGQIKCPKCDKVFTSNFGKNYHVRMKVCDIEARGDTGHNEAVATCDRCNKSFTTMAGMRYHIAQSKCAQNIKKVTKAKTKGEASKKKVVEKRDQVDDSDSSSLSEEDDYLQISSQRRAKMKARGKLGKVVKDMCSDHSSSSSSSSEESSDVSSHKIFNKRGQKRSRISGLTSKQRSKRPRTTNRKKIVPNSYGRKKLPLSVYLKYRNKWITDAGYIMANALHTRNIERQKKSGTCGDDGLSLPANILEDILHDTTSGTVTDGGEESKHLHHWVDEANFLSSLDISSPDASVVPAVTLRIHDTSTGNNVQIAPLHGKAYFVNGQLECAINAGGPIWSSTFAPKNSENGRTDCEQQFAVSLSRIGFPDPQKVKEGASDNSYYTPTPCSYGVGSDKVYLSSEKYEHPSLLQIWSLKVVSNDDDDDDDDNRQNGKAAGAKVQLSYSVGACRGPIWKVLWSPFPPSTDISSKNKLLGIAAAIYADGSCTVMALPTRVRQPGGSWVNEDSHNISASESIVIDEAVVKIWSFEHQDLSVIAADWSPHEPLHLCLSLSDGSCGVWDVRQDCDINAPYFWLISPNTVIKEGDGQSNNCISQVVQFCPYHPHLILTGGTDNVVRLWDISSSIKCREVYVHRLSESPKTDIGMINSLKWDPSGCGIYISGANNSTVLWDPLWSFANSTRKPRYGLYDHGSAVSCVWEVSSFKYDNQTVLLSVSSNGTVNCALPSYAGRTKQRNSKFLSGMCLLKMLEVGTDEGAMEEDEIDKSAEMICSLRVSMGSEKPKRVTTKTASELHADSLAIHSIDSTAIIFPAVEHKIVEATDSHDNHDKTPTNCEQMKSQELRRMCMYGGATGLLRLQTLPLSELLHKQPK